MSLVNEKVEIGFDLQYQGAPYFTLDDAVRGVLDNTLYPLGGYRFIDVTDRVLSYSINRGKSRGLDRFQTGTASVIFNNNDRAFDPTYTASPFYGQVIPRREIRITSNDLVQYRGLVDDWDLSYEPGNASSRAMATITDGFAVLNKQTVTAGTATAQYSGARVSAVLNDTNVGWPTSDRDISTGDMLLGADTISSDTNALSYLQLVETSEPGLLFMSKDNHVTFLGRNDLSSGSSLVILADDGTGIKYQSMQVVYGSELLYNRVVIDNYAGVTVTASDLTSEQTYGVAVLSETGLLVQNTPDLVSLATYWANSFSEPELRFESVSVVLNDLSESDQNKILDLEMGDVVQITFTPNNIPPAISKYAQVIKIAHSATPGSHRVDLGFATLDTVALVLDDVVFGILDTATLGF